MWNRALNAFRFRAMATAIIGLFFWGNPFTVLFFIITVVVNTLNLSTAVTGIVFAVYNIRIFHVFKKRFRLVPTLADNYSTTAISRIRSVIRIVATLNHRTPYAIDSCSCHSMLFASLRSIFSLKASTRSSVVTSQTICVCNNIITAITMTVPKRFPVFRSKIGNYCQALKSLSSMIYPYIFHVNQYITTAEVCQ